MAPSGARLESASVKKARHTSVLRVRRALALGFALFVLAVAGLYWWGRSQRGAGLAVPRENGDGTDDPMGTVLVGEGFAFELTDHGRRVFGIQAARILSRQQNDFSLEGVVLSVEREGGGEYRVESDRARYNVKSKHTLLQGKVVLTGPDGVTLRTDGLEMRRHGRYLMSTSPVRFEFGGGYVGRARGLEADFRADQFLLAGEVEVRSQPGMFPAFALDARRVTYNREARQLQVDGDVVLGRGDDRLVATRLTLQLAEDERTPRQLDALWGVRLDAVEGRSDGLPHRLGAAGHELRLGFAEDGAPSRADLVAGPHPVARATLEAAGLVQAIESRAIVAEFRDRRLASLAGDDGVELEEYLAAAPQPSLRWICGETLRLTISPSGEIGALTVDGGVDLAEPWTQGRTPRMQLDEVSGDLLLEGPGTWIARDGVRVASPRIAIDPERGEVHAVDGVRADLERGQGVTLGPGAEREEPLHVVAEEATWQREEGFRFAQSVRAWQGPNYLLAQTLGGDGEEFDATGPIKTVWETTDQGRQPDDAEAEDGPPPPLEVTAQQLRYSRAERVLVYDGSPRARRGKANLLCREIRLHLDETDELELMECKGPVQIDDPESGNKVYGDNAEYRPDLEKVRVTGDPVRLVDRDGAQFEGKAVFYDFDRGTAELASQAGGADDPFGPVPEPPAPEPAAAGEEASPAEESSVAAAEDDSSPPPPAGRGA